MLAALVAAGALLVALLAVTPASAATASGKAPPGKQILTRAMAWEIELTTTGGLMESGIGGIRLSSSGEVVAGRGFELDCRKRIDESVVSRIDREVSASQPDRWPPSYALPSKQGKAPDHVTYRLKFTRQGPRAASYETSWTDLDLKRLPAPLVKLMDDLNDLKASVLDGCK